LAGLFFPLQQSGLGHGLRELGDFDFFDGHDEFGFLDSGRCRDVSVR
jgi:hypothetical protein